VVGFVEDQEHFALAEIEAKVAEGSGRGCPVLWPRSSPRLASSDQVTECPPGHFDAPEPPVHLFLGSDALKRARSPVEQITQQLDQWEDLSNSISFQESR
jgi:hypothetical protein